MYKKKYYSKAEKAKYAAYMARKRSQTYSRKKYNVAPAISGHGDYKLDFKGPLRAAGGWTGSTLGRAGLGPVGKYAGKYLGDKIGSFVGGLMNSITGWGDYSVSSNSLIFPTKAIPTFVGDNSIRIRHKEFIGNVSSSDTFENQTFDINPGNQTSFPWLQTIAQNYEQYNINGMIGYYRSTSADALNSTNTALGKVIIAADYNSADNEFLNSEQMYSSMHANSGPPSKDLLFAVECAPSNKLTKSLFVRTGEVPSNQDQRLYDHCKLQLATEGSQASSVIGELWVVYDITLFNPVQNALAGFNVKSAKMQFTLPVNTTAHHFGTDSEWDYNGIDGLYLSADSTITFPKMLGSGTFLICYRVRGDSTAVVNPTFNATNCTLKTVWQGNTISTASNSSTTTLNYMLWQVVRIDKPGAYLEYTVGTLNANITSGDLFITQVNHSTGTTYT